MQEPRGTDEGFLGWLNRRAGVDQLLRGALAEPIPGGARFAYVFGSGLLFLFLSQIITGVFLAMYYVPSAEHAHVSVAYIVKMVAAGSFLRSVHAYGSSAIIIVLLLHLTQVFLYGSYKGRRELLWLAGVVLLFLMAGMSFTGYLLPWDQNAYFATTVGTNLISQVPWIGQGLTNLLRGGTSMGTLTVSRFFVIHVFLLPAFIFLFVIIHVYLFRRAGAAGPTNEDPFVPRLRPEMFYPRQVGMDMTFTFLVIAVLGFLAHFHPFELGPAANLANTQYYPRPEWYYRPMFEELKYFPGSLEIVGSVVIPSILIGLLILAPFIDRSRERRPWKRPIAMGIYSVVLLVMIGLGALSYWQDQSRPERCQATAATARGSGKLHEGPVQALPGGNRGSCGGFKQSPGRKRQSSLYRAGLQFLPWRSRSRDADGRCPGRGDYETFSGTDRGHHPQAAFRSGCGGHAGIRSFRRSDGIAACLPGEPAVGPETRCHGPLGDAKAGGQIP